MTISIETEIAGRNTVADWQKLCIAIDADMGSNELWEKAYSYFEERLTSRYLDPIDHIQKNSIFEGEGFAITAILCSLIEALESFYQGKSYRKATETNPLDNNFEYFASKGIFESFLKNREPFKNHFISPDLATDFYENIRCAILHEAATRNGWKIRIDTQSLIEQNGSSKIINRVIFVQYIKIYIENYKIELLGSNDLKKAFIRKFNAICAST